MCSIFGSFNKNRVIELAELNQFKGTFSYSLTQDDRSHKAFGKFDNDIVNDIVQTDNYIIGHVQAPTGGMIKDDNRIHPTSVGQSLLWHNGLLTKRGIKYLQDYLDTTEEFDTKLLHEYFVRYNFTFLNKIEGLFTCIFKHGTGYYVFRTKHGKLYVNEELDLSSERFEGSKCINYDTIYKMNFAEKRLQPVSYFKTNRYNFIIKGELDD
jgi:hypothetical protein